MGTEQEIKIIEEFANRKSSENIVGWGNISKALAKAINALERENSLRGKWIRSSDTVICPSCQCKNHVDEGLFIFYCQGCGRKIVK